MNQDNILRALGAGAVLVAVRHYPLTRKFVLRHPDNKDTGRDGKQETVTESAVIRLVNAGLVKPEPKDPQWDTVNYPLTEKGIARAAKAPLSAGEKRGA